MRTLLTVLSGIVFVAFVILFTGVMLSGCGGCGYGDQQCFTYPDGETICYDQEPCSDEDDY